MNTLGYKQKNRFTKPAEVIFDHQAMSERAQDSGAERKLGLHSP